jgi:hypothetical protein
MNANCRKIAGLLLFSIFLASIVPHAGIGNLKSRNVCEVG